MIIDLRHYTLKANTRDQFIERCETLLFPEQKRLGANILGVFRDANNPNGIVWLRAMPDMAERNRILTAFYKNGEMWKANRKEVNSWIVDSDNVLLVKPLSDLMTSSMDNSVVVMYTCLKQEPFIVDEKLDDVSRAISGIGGLLLVKLVTDPSKNNYPLHPIRTGEFGFVLFASIDPKFYQPLGLCSVEERKLFPTQQSWLR
jgi:hypothetical protein